MPKKIIPPDLSTLSHDEKDKYILSLFARLNALELKADNSSRKPSKPPSSDDLTGKTR
jgi:hypothetical protein